MTDTDFETLWRTVWGESRDQPYQGKVAVACVILNRFNSKRWFAGPTVAETCQKPGQFSCWNADDPNRAKMLAVSEDDPIVKICQQAAVDAEDGNGPAWMRPDVWHYKRIDAPAAWAAGHAPVGVIGAHEFFEGIG